MTPEEIVRSPALGRAQKVGMLRDLAYDAAEVAVAVEEGMPGEDADLQQRTQLALHALGADLDVEHSGPTKQHVTCLRRPVES